MRKKIIVMFYEKNRDQELNMTLYDFLNGQFLHGNRTVVCHVTEEEYTNMKKQVQRGGLNERNVRISSKKQGYCSLRYLMLFDDNDNKFMISDYDNPEKKGSYAVDENGLRFCKDMPQFVNQRSAGEYLGGADKVYTTETYEEVLAHYKKFQDSVTIITSDEWKERYLAAASKLSLAKKPTDITEADLEEMKILFNKIVEE